MFRIKPELTFFNFLYRIAKLPLACLLFLQLGVIFRDTNACMLKRLFYGKVNIKAHKPRLTSNTFHCVKAFKVTKLRMVTLK